jgi:hypothetical protein
LGDWRLRRGRNSYRIQDVAGRSPFRTVLQDRELRPVASPSEGFAVCCLKLFHVSCDWIPAGYTQRGHSSHLNSFSTPSSQRSHSYCTLAPVMIRMMVQISLAVLLGAARAAPLLLRFPPVVKVCLCRDTLHTPNAAHFSHLSSLVIGDRPRPAVGACEAPIFLMAGLAHG